MTSSIDLTNIKNGLISTYEGLKVKSGQWLGRGITLLKSGRETMLSYLQDVRIAVVSLIAVNIISLEMGLFFAERASTYTRMSLRTSRLIFGMGTWGASVLAFSNLTNLPLNWLTITGISVGTLLVRISCD